MNGQSFPPGFPLLRELHKAADLPVVILSPGEESLKALRFAQSDKWIVTSSDVFLLFPRYAGQILQVS